MILHSVDGLAPLPSPLRRKRSRRALIFAGGASAPRFRSQGHRQLLFAGSPSAPNLRLRAREGSRLLHQAGQGQQPYQHEGEQNDNLTAAAHLPPSDWQPWKGPMDHGSGSSHRIHRRQRHPGRRIHRDDFREYRGEQAQTLAIVMIDLHDQDPLARGMADLRGDGLVGDPRAVEP